MTIFAGAFAFADDAALDSANIACWSQFFRGLGNDGRQLQHVESQRLAVWKWDSGAYGEPAWQTGTDGSFATLCGDALLTQGGRRLTRSEQLARLCDHPDGLSEAQLRTTRGVFSLLAFDGTTSTLHLATDMIGIRPIFYTSQNGVFYFASAQHLLERLPALQRSVDQQGLAEHLTLGFSLGDRTPYQELKLLPEATWLQVDGRGHRQHHYFDWNSVGLSGTAEDAAGPALFEAFSQAVGIRLDGHQTAYAFLSGGMDSRSIVATLASHGCRIEAMNFSIEDTQDKAFAVAYAATLQGQCRLTQHTTHNFPNFSMLARSALTERAASDAGAAPNGPVQQIWSGDGGSVCLGYVYLDDAIMQIAHAGDWPAAARALMQKNKLQVPSGLSPRRVRDAMDKTFFDGVVAELKRYDNGDHGRRLYFFLLFNDQRRHLSKHFETIHEHTLELVLPFFDTQFVTTVVGTPAQWGIGHRLYGKFFAQLPADTRSVPWQTYPGHEPCPIQPSQTYRYQWAQKSNGAADQPFSVRKASASAMLGLLNRPELAPLLSKTHVATAAALHLSGMRDYEYLASAAHKLASLRITSP